MLVEAGGVMLDWIQQVALDENYANPEVTISYADKVEESNATWGDEAEAEEAPTA